MPRRSLVSAAPPDPPDGAMPGWDGKSRMELRFALTHFGPEFLERLVGGGWRNFSAESASSRKELPWWVTLHLARGLWARGKLPASPWPSHPAREEVLALMAEKDYEEVWRQVSAIYKARKKEKAEAWRALKWVLDLAVPKDDPGPQ